MNANVTAATGTITVIADAADNTTAPAVDWCCPECGAIYAQDYASAADCCFDIKHP